MEKNNEAQNEQVITEEMMNEQFRQVTTDCGIAEATAKFAELSGKECAVLTIMVQRRQIEGRKATLVAQGFIGNPGILVDGLAQVLSQEDTDEEHDLMRDMVDAAVKKAKMLRMMNKLKSGDVQGALQGMGGLDALMAIIGVDRSNGHDTGKEEQVEKPSEEQK